MEKGEDIFSACINMRHITTCLRASLQFFITQNDWIAVIVFSKASCMLPEGIYCRSAISMVTYASEVVCGMTHWKFLPTSRPFFQSIQQQVVKSMMYSYLAMQFISLTLAFGQIRHLSLALLSLSRSPEFVLHFVMIHSCLPYCMAKVQYQFPPICHRG